MDTPIYKICSKDEWDAAAAQGSYAGSADDARDGFIHFSTFEQLRETLRRYFAGQADLVALVVTVSALGESDLRWEPSRGGDLFPHLYGPLPVTAVAQVISMIEGADGIPCLPAPLPESISDV